MIKRHQISGKIVINFRYLKFKYVFHGYTIQPEAKYEK